MRFHLVGLLLLASVATPALSQQRPTTIDGRVGRLEQEMRAVQRRVFPGGQVVLPEIGAQTPPPTGVPGVSGDALSSLNARVDALEAQLRQLTGQVEEQGYRNRMIEEQLTRLRTDLQGRIDRLEQQAPAVRVTPPVPVETPRNERPAPTETTTATADPTAPAPARPTDDAEAAYNAGYRLWNAGQYAEAQQALEQAATSHPNSRWASWARNLQGRAYLDDNKPATAARILLANYQGNPQGERAADSLYYLGQSLTRLNRRSEACRVYDELEQVYPNMRDFIRTRLPQARTDARCGAAQ